MTAYAIKSGSQQHKQNTRDAIASRTPFKTGGSLQGVAGKPGTLGRLNDDERAQYFVDADSIDYTVLSYGTPIAWHTSTEDMHSNSWHIVEQRFSVTTSNQQSVVRIALAD